MFGGEKDPDNGDKVDVIVEVYQPSFTLCLHPSWPVLYCTSQYCTVLHSTVLYTLPGVRSQQRGQERRGQAAAGGRGGAGGLQ